MTYQFLSFKNKIIVPFGSAIVICMLFCGCFKDIPETHIAYENGFETQDTSNIMILGAQGIVDSLKIFEFNHNHVLGRFRDNDVVLQVAQLPVHNIIKIEYDLYLHDDWRGNYIPAGGAYPDLWQMKINGTAFFLTNFSNGSFDQSFPDNYQPVLINHPAFSNAWGKYPGVCSKLNQSDGTSLYHLEYFSGHSDTGPMRLEFQDVNFNAGSQWTKSWSIDNIKITTTNKQ